MKRATEVLDKPDGRGRPAVADLRKVSPCEHGKCIHITHVNDGAEFWVPECVDTRGRPRYHKATAERYPILERLT